MNNDTNVLPPDFDGIFRFTNATDEDFVGRWNSIDYTYPANKMTPMIIPGATPEEVQHIRKKFAKDLAIREFFKSQKGQILQGQERNADGSPRLNSFQQASTYSDGDLAPFIEKCLTPLPLARQEAKRVAPKEIPLRKDEEGNPVTEVIQDKKRSLKGQGTAIED